MKLTAAPLLAPPPIKKTVMSKKKKFRQRRNDPIPAFIQARLVKETDKGILVLWEGEQHWLPKSQVRIQTTHLDLAVPQWLFKKMS